MAIVKEMARPELGQPLQLVLNSSLDANKNLGQADLTEPHPHPSLTFKMSISTVVSYRLKTPSVLHFG
jgi:hypothetical protein